MTRKGNVAAEGGGAGEGWGVGGSHTISGSDRRLEEGMFIQSSDPIFHDPQNKRLALYGQTGSFQLSRVRRFLENTRPLLLPLPSVSQSAAPSFDG